MGILEALGNWGQWTGEKDKDAALNHGLLQAGLALLGSQGNFRQALAQGGMAGLEGYGQAQNQQIAAKKQQAQERKDAQLQQAIANFAGGGAPAGLLSQAPAGNELPAKPTLASAAALRLMGGPDMREFVKDMATGFKRESGVEYINSQTGIAEYLPQLPTGMTRGQGGNAMQVPGFADANADIEARKAFAIKDAEQRAQIGFDERRERLKASLDPIQVPGAVEGTFNYVPRGQLSGQPAQALSPGGWNAINAQSKAAQPGRDSVRLQVITQELQTERDPAMRQALAAELKTLGGERASNQPMQAAQVELAGPQTYGYNKAAANAANDLNQNWIKTTFNDVQKNGQAASKILTDVAAARGALSNLGANGQGWGADSKAAAANFLSSIGLSSEKIDSYAANAQLFQQAAISKMNSGLMAQNGVQTASDEARFAKEFATLKNRPEANAFILDRGEAQAKLDKIKSDFYNETLPHAKNKGDLTIIDREWYKRAPSIYDMPSMSKWQSYGKK